LLFGCVVVFVYCCNDVLLQIVGMLYCCFVMLSALCIVLLVYYIVVLVCIVIHVNLSVRHQGTFKRTAAAMLI
jgi:hypothetical protein